MQPDTIIPDLANPQNLNRYSYVTNRPINFNDPTGHRLDDGCGTVGCSLSQYQKDQDAQKLTLLEEESRKRKCKAGDENYCPTVETHPVEVVTFTVTGLILAGAGPEILSASYGILYEGTRTVLWYGSYLCLSVSPCQNIITKGNDLAVLGRFPRFRDVGEKLGANILNVTNWTQAINDKFVNRISSNSQTVFLTDQYLKNTATIFYGEVAQLLNKGYTNFMDIFLFPPKP